MTEKEALTRAMKLCSSKEYASTEILEKLLEWGTDKEAASKAIDYLRKEKFIDDHRYCRAYVNDKLRFSKWGRIKIEFMLRQKGVDAAVISSALGEIEEPVYEKILQEEMEKKARTIRAGNDYEFKGKLIRFASGRGFEYELAGNIADKILKNNGAGLA